MDDDAKLSASCPADRGLDGSVAVTAAARWYSSTAGCCMIMRAPLLMRRVPLPLPREARCTGPRVGCEGLPLPTGSTSVARLLGVVKRGSRAAAAASCLLLLRCLTASGRPAAGVGGVGGVGSGCSAAAVVSLRHPELKVSTPAHTKHIGWYLEFEFRGTYRSALGRQSCRSTCESSVAPAAARSAPKIAESATNSPLLQRVVSYQLTIAVSFSMGDCSRKSRD